MRWTYIAGTFLSCMEFLCAGVATAQDYPNKPIRVVAAQAGSSGDIVIRLMIAGGLAEFFGQPMVVDNRSHVIVTGDILARAPADGYTLSLNGSALWNTPFLQKTAYDPLRDFSPITLTNNSPHIVAVNPAIPVNTVKELIALAKSKPGQLNYSTVDPASIINLAAELFKSMTGVNMVGVTYKGTAQAVNGVIGGEVQLMFPPAGAATPHIKSGRLKALAVTSARPSALVPGLITVAASGLPGYEAGNMNGMFAPARTPAAIVNRINRETVRLLNKPEVKEKFLNIGVEAATSSPQEFATVIAADMARVGKLIKDVGIRAE